MKNDPSWNAKILAGRNITILLALGRYLGNSPMKEWKWSTKEIKIFGSNQDSLWARALARALRSLEEGVQDQAARVSLAMMHPRNPSWIDGLQEQNVSVKWWKLYERFFFFFFFFWWKVETIKSIRDERIDYGATGLVTVKRKTWSYFKENIHLLMVRIFLAISKAIWFSVINCLWINQREELPES